MDKVNGIVLVLVLLAWYVYRDTSLRHGNILVAPKNLEHTLATNAL